MELRAKRVSRKAGLQRGTLRIAERVPYTRMGRRRRHQHAGRGRSQKSPPRPSSLAHFPLDQRSIFSFKNLSGTAAVLEHAIVERLDVELRSHRLLRLIARFA